MFKRAMMLFLLYICVCFALAQVQQSQLKCKMIKKKSVKQNDTIPGVLC